MNRITQLLESSGFYTARSKEHRLITSLQAFGITLVVLGHALQIEHRETMLENVIYQFHMPLFMLMSGFLMRYSSRNIHELKIGTFLSKRATRLLLPYFALSSLVFIPKALLSRYAVRPVPLDLKAYLHMLFFPNDNVIRFFWFLPTLFVIMVLILLVYKLNRKDTAVWQDLLLLLVFYVLSMLYERYAGLDFIALNKIIFYLFFFYLGIVYCKYEGQIETFLFSGRIKSLIVFLLCLLAFWLLMRAHARQWLIAPVGILASIALFKSWIPENPVAVKIVSLYSYQIYLLSWFPQAGLLSLYQHNFVPASGTTYDLFVLLSLVCGMLVPLVIAFLARRMKVPLWMGRIIGL